ncbi:MAG: hypothetical protein U1G08_12095 [Verrucomicrobiota bacterium]
MRRAGPCQDRTLWYATHGYCVLALDTLEFGEVARDFITAPTIYRS